VERFQHKLVVADIAVNEPIVRAVLDRAQGLKARRIGELVKIDDVVMRIGRQVTANSGADKPGAPGNKDMHSLPPITQTPLPPTAAVLPDPYLTEESRQRQEAI